MTMKEREREGERERQRQRQGEIIQAERTTIREKKKK